MTQFCLALDELEIELNQLESKDTIPLNNIRLFRSIPLKE